MQGAALGFSGFLGLGGWLEEQQREAGGEADGEQQRGEQRDGHGDGERAEEAAGDGGDGDERQEDDDGGDGGADEGDGDLAQGTANGLMQGLAAVAVKDDVFNDDDGIVDDEADGGGEAAEGHEVEAFTDEPECEDGGGDGDRNDQAGDERGAPVMQEEVRGCRRRARGR